MIMSLGDSSGRVVRRFAALLLAPILALALTGCGDDRGAAPDGSPPSPPFYEIAAADGTVEGWMLGTIHALPDGARWRTPVIGRVMGEADLLIVEVKELGGREDGRSIYASLAQSAGQPALEQRVPRDLHHQLAGLMERGALSDSAFTSTESWAAAIALARVDATGDPANGVDSALIDDFTGRPVRELEGLRGQLSIFDRLPETQQRAMLAAVVRGSETARKDPERLQRAWLAGDAAIIEQSTHEGFLAEPALREALLTGRNRRWAAAIIPVLEQAPRPLIAVGAAHLVGPDGLAALLEAKGYRVRRLP
jgi:uncharacterized protein YbaP (TraB family)